MAAEYKVTELEYEVLTSCKSTASWSLKYFEYCVLNKIQIKDHSKLNIDMFVKDELFISLHPDAVYEILKLQRGTTTEVDIFRAVSNWLVAYCETQQITLSEGRQHYWDKIIRNIRFKSLTIAEILECYEKFPELFSHDRILICNEIACEMLSFNDGNHLNNLSPQLETRTFQHNAIHSTIFSIAKDTILHEVRIGREMEHHSHIVAIRITEIEIRTRACKNMYFSQKSNNHAKELTINLRGGIKLKPNLMYRISLKYFGAVGNINVLCRKGSTDVSVSDPGRTIKRLYVVSDNVMKLVFKPV